MWVLIGGSYFYTQTVAGGDIAYDYYIWYYDNLLTMLEQEAIGLFNERQVLLHDPNYISDIGEMKVRLAQINLRMDEMKTEVTNALRQLDHYKGLKLNIHSDTFMVVVYGIGIAGTLLALYLQN